MEEEREELLEPRERGPRRLPRAHFPVEEERAHARQARARPHEVEEDERDREEEPGERVGCGESHGTVFCPVARPMVSLSFPAK